MRTTLTLDPDVVQLLEEEKHRQRRPFKEIVNDAASSAEFVGRHRFGQSAVNLAPRAAIFGPG
jgi:hypothetical protein